MPTHVVDQGLEGLPKPTLPGVKWRLLGLPVAGLVVILALNAIQDSEPFAAPAVAPVSSTPDPKPTTAERVSGASKDASLVNEATFQLALPAGWDRVANTDGAAFSAVAEDGFADATLWVSREKGLNFAAFEARALTQLESLAGSAAVIERNLGPTPETTSIRLAPTEAPQGAPNFEVTLRSSGQYWYHLATTVQPDASSRTAAAVDLVRGSLVPTGAKR